MGSKVSQKILYILRHAKAEVGAAGGEDHERKLAERGIKNAKVMGKYLVKKRIHPQIVLCSSAVRAQQTFEYIQEAYAETLSVEDVPKLYLASANEIIGVLSKLPENISSVMIVGHNPGFHELCMKLGHDGDEKLLDTMRIKFPTCSFAAISLECRWKDLAKTRGELEMFVVPKEL